jgi:hypothetical protein
MSPSVRWVACTAVVRGPSTPWSASSRVGVQPCAFRQASFSAVCSERWTWSGRRPPLGPAGDGRELIAGTARTEWMAAPIRAFRRPSARRPARPRRPRRRRRSGAGADRRPPSETGGEVAGVEEGDADTGLGRGRDQGVPHRVGVGVGAAAGRVVQVVELADAGDARPAPSRRTRRGPARSSCPGSSRPATSYITSRQVQKVPRPPPDSPRLGFVLPAQGSRWKAWLWALARPGTVSPRRGHGTGRMLGGTPGRDGGDPPVRGHHDDHVRHHLAVQPGVLRPVGLRRQ